MKKILFLLLFVISLNCFGQVFGDWQTGEIVDEWGDSTGQKYIAVLGAGYDSFFRIMKDKSSNLTITIKTDKFLDNEDESRTSQMRIDSNKPYELTGYTWGAEATNNISIYYFPDNLISEMKSGTKLRTINYTYNDLIVLNSFSLNGFTKAYNWLLK